MTVIKPQILARKTSKILSILKNIVENEGNNSLIEYPVLIGSCAAKWHVPSFRVPNDWDLVATPSQSTLFINKVMPNTNFEDIKLIHYPGTGLKIVGNCNESLTGNSNYMDGNSTYFDIELASDKLDLRRIKSIDAKKSDILDEVNKIEFEELNDNQPKMSAQMILEICRDVEYKTLFPLSGLLCTVAPLKVLEALKSSHIYWPTNFHKNIADLHSLRVLSGYTMNQPLNLQRDEKIELMLKTRIKETEARQGIPGAHINLNKTNEEFLDRENDLFVQRRISHDELHERVKYGDRPIYETLKDDKSKAWIKKSLFQQIDYQTQLNCVKEEAMVIALERYLIPMISKNHEFSYQSALVRICTTLTKGWFRQFAIDNYPRLSKLDKDLLSIAHDIIKNHPLQQKKLSMWSLDQETQAIFNSIEPHTKMILHFDELREDLDQKSESYEINAERSGFKITSPVNNVSITAVITNVFNRLESGCHPDVCWSASIVILPSEDFEFLSDTSIKSTEYFDPLLLHPYNCCNKEKLEQTSKHIFTCSVYASIRESWGTGNEDVWDYIRAHAKSADSIASKLEIPEFTGDLLFKYVLAYLRPTLQNNGESPFQHKIDKMKVDGIVPVKPKQHLWYDIWNYTLKNKGKWEERSMYSNDRILELIK